MLSRESAEEARAMKWQWTLGALFGFGLAVLLIALLGKSRAAPTSAPGTLRGRQGAAGDSTVQALRLGATLGPQVPRADAAAAPDAGL